LTEEIQTLAQEFPVNLSSYSLISLYDPADQIDAWESNRIYTSLQELNPNHEKDVYLFLVSRGGQIEPAYLISKICKMYANARFSVAIPRMAKSAATLIALGADEIHMGMLGELGPIDPQVGDLPALGVKKALQTIAGVCEEYPGSSSAFAQYMAKKLTIEQIGYCERVSESAVQYAERLLGKRATLSGRASQIAKQLVYEYKDHGFVIDVEEARTLLEEDMVITDSPEIQFAEKLYQKLEHVNMMFGLAKRRRFTIVGDLRSDVFTYPTKS
jgi:ClpP class serine protease